MLACLGLLMGSGAAQARPASKGGPNCGPVTGQALKCPQFGFTYKVPFGWVDRTQTMQSPQSAEATEDHAAENAGTSEGAASPTSGGSNSKQPSNLSTAQTLLAVFERPPGATGESVNSAVVIATEPRENYPQVKTAADYFGPISDLAANRGFKALSDPYTFSVGGRQLVREDFSAEHGKLNISQSSLVMFAKGQIVSFTFISGKEDDVEELISNLSFAATPARHGRP
jgi:hypothetical protein